MASALLRPTRPARVDKPRAEIYARLLRDLAKARRDVSPVNESKIARAVGSVREGWRLIETDGSRALLVPTTEGAHGIVPKQCLALPDATWAIPAGFGVGLRRMLACTRRQRNTTVAISSTRTGATWPGTVAEDRVWLQYGDADRGALWADDCTYAREWFPATLGGMPNLPVLVDLRYLAGYWDDTAELSLTWTGDVLHVDAAGAWRYVVMGMTR